MPSLPPTTKALILACVAVFCIAFFVPLGPWFALWSLGSGHFLPWQPLTYAFLHFDPAHLFFNMLGLWMFGADLERLWGRKRFLQFLAASVVVAAMTQLAFNALAARPTSTIGASGALFGLLLGYALSFPRRQFDLIGFLPVVLFMVPNTLINLLGFALFFMLLTNRAAVPIPPLPVPAMAMVAVYGGIELMLGLFFRSGGGAQVAHFAHLGGMLGAWLIMAYWRGRGPFASRR